MRSDFQVLCGPVGNPGEPGPDDHAILSLPADELEIRVAATSGGQYRATLQWDASLLCVSRVPFLDAARVLLGRGYDPQTKLIMRHEGSGTDCLHATIAAAAAMTVEETKFGPRLRDWKANSALEGSPQSRFSELCATPVAPPTVSALRRPSTETRHQFKTSTAKAA